MLQINELPHVLAGLNATTTAFLVAGFMMIRRGDQARHRLCMIAALACSAIFLAIYLYYHANAGLAKFGGTGMIRPVYFTILIAHIVGSTLILGMVPMTVFLSVTGRFERHRAWARWTLPVWLYVAVSGLVVYVLAVHMFPFSDG
jgi:uncharacterized membrane protein YozB (DUF420 family)